MSNTPLEQNGIDLDSVLAKVNALPRAVEPVINPLSVTENGTYNVPSGVDGYSPVTVNVPQGITPSGIIDITDDGTYDVTEYASANVNVSGGGGNAEQSKGSYTYASMSAVDVVIPHGLSGIPDVIIVQSSKIGTTASHNAYRGGLMSNIASLGIKLAMYTRSGAKLTEYETLGSTGYFSVDETNITLKAGTGTYHWEAGATVYWAAFKEVSE